MRRVQRTIGTFLLDENGVAEEEVETLRGVMTLAALAT
jgi:hypothetical protein